MLNKFKNKNFVANMWNLLLSVSSRPFSDGTFTTFSDRSENIIELTLTSSGKTVKTHIVIVVYRYSGLQSGTEFVIKMGYLNKHEFTLCVVLKKVNCDN